MKSARFGGTYTKIGTEKEIESEHPGKRHGLPVF